MNKSTKTVQFFIDEMEKDFEIGKELDFHKEENKTINLHAKWWRYFVEYSEKLEEVEEELSKARKKWMLYYRNDPSMKSMKRESDKNMIFRWDSQTQLNQMIETEEDVVALRKEFNRINTICNFIQDVAKNRINTRGYVLKNMLEYMKETKWGSY